MIRTVPVALGDRSYDVRIGPGLIARAGAEIAPLLSRPRVAIVTDENVAAAVGAKRLFENFLQYAARVRAEKSATGVVNESGEPADTSETAADDD